jgi:hypothetical protein
MGKASEALPSPKFRSLNGPDAFIYPNIWAQGKTTGPDRLIIAPSAGHVELLLELSRVLPEPFGILYVLTLPRISKEGRYQSPAPTDRAETEAFFRDYREFFEGDGRHHVWIMSLPAKATLIYDHHNVIYAYGPLDKYKQVLAAKGLKEEPDVCFPVPHEHNFNACYDSWEEKILAHWAWKHFPLKEQG